MNNVKRSKWGIAILTVLAVGLLAGCSDNKSADASKVSDQQAEVQDSKQTSNEEKKVEAKEEQPVSDGHENEADVETFISKEGGFSLELPEMWTNTETEVVGIVEGKDEIMKNIDWQTSFYLIVNGKADESSGPLMTISKMTKENYEIMAKEEGPALGEKLDENDKYVWILSLPQSNPYDEKSEEFKKFNDMVLDFDFVKERFHVSN